MSNKSISGFSKFSKAQKIEWINDHYLHKSDCEDDFKKFWLEDESMQRVIDGFSENTISNFVLPYGLAPNFLIDGEIYSVPMVIEESSVVAAASSAAKFWQDKGGFKTTILGTTKVGQIHFTWGGQPQKLASLFIELKPQLIKATHDITENMEKRGGGIRGLELIDFTEAELGLYQLRVYFDTRDSMGANFINSVLERMSSTLEQLMLDSDQLSEDERDITIIMSILSNNTPECVVRSEVSCPVDMLGKASEKSLAGPLAEKFRLAVRIAEIDPYRATTHNKGIYNGIDSVVLATGNDFRAIEAAGHTYAARSGQYSSLSHCEIIDGIFRFWLDVPLALGTVGGLTSLHPLAQKTLEILGNPSAEKLMSIIASVGLAQNFAALKSLVTTGIQRGHMKMHLMNILNRLGATEAEIVSSLAYFSDKTVSYAEVRQYHNYLRGA
jgi:hydroxymethylglutaryl-CoA reductase